MLTTHEWFEQYRAGESFRRFAQNPVAYFCMEYALPQNIPIYAGGLGVLAGDYVREAKEQSFPLVAVGLYYYKHRRVNKDGETIFHTEGPAQFGLTKVTGANGKPIILHLPIGGRTIALQAWLYQNGTIPVYLLDTNLDENDPADQAIVDFLYTADNEVRIKQEIILGVGGVRLLRALGITPSVFHMNEGHSAFLVYELAARVMKERSLNFEQAFSEAKRYLAFTNHTLVVTAHDQFDLGLLSNLLNDYAAEIGVSVFDLVAKGSDPNQHNNFSTTHLAFEASAKVNAVSVLHAEAAKEVWPSQSMLPITNGVNLSRWDTIIDESRLMDRHVDNKRKLLAIIQSETGVLWSEHDLIVGWARRVVEYKRPLAWFEDLARTKELIANPERPVRLVFSGRTHRSDAIGKEFIDRLRSLAENELKDCLVYLENYNTDLSNLMVSGCDVWLNTPIVRLEACGTSGMKAALNGTLLCSTRDGWLPEIDLPRMGYQLESNNIYHSLIDTFSTYIIPTFYNDKSEWLRKMTESRHTIIERFGTDRMFKDYIEQIYQPILDSSLGTAT